MRNRIGQTVQRDNTLTTRFLRSETQSTAQRFFMFHYRYFGCPLKVFAALLGFKLLQFVARSRGSQRLLQNVPNGLQTVATSKNRRFVSCSRSLKAYGVRASGGDGNKFRSAIQEDNQI